MTGPRRGQRGFTLLEVLVAFSILGLSLGVLIQAFGGGLRNTALAEEYTLATLHAESLLAGLGVEEPLQPGELAGEIDGRFRWQARIEEYVPEEALDDPFAVSDILPVVPYRVALEVFWPGGAGAAGERRVTLETLRLIPDLELRP